MIKHVLALAFRPYEAFDRAAFTSIGGGRPGYEISFKPASKR